MLLINVPSISDSSATIPSLGNIMILFDGCLESMSLLPLKCNIPNYWGTAKSVLCSLLTWFLDEKPIRPRDFPTPEGQSGRPLPEDFVLRGQLYEQSYFPTNWFEDISPMLKRGLPGFINGSPVSALADTGAAHNVVSAAFARKESLVIQGKTAEVKLGNSKRVRTIGTVKVNWAFADKPAELYDIVCHVLPHCTYDVILGDAFLTVTETYSKHLHRLANCVFSMSNMFHLNFLNGGRRTLSGKVGGHQVSAIPDTGAERNIMDLDYANAHGFEMRTQPEDRGFLQFADGTVQRTFGRVKTTWTFTSGFKIPITFEILEQCSADVIFGEDVLWEHDVFRSHAASLQETSCDEEKSDEPFDLAPFRYERRWERTAGVFKQKISSIFNKEDTREANPVEQFEAEERRRRAHWNYEHGFDGAKASPAEREAEARRRRRFDVRREAMIRCLSPHFGQNASVLTTPGI